MQINFFSPDTREKRKRMKPMPTKFGQQNEKGQEIRVHAFIFYIFFANSPMDGSPPLSNV